MELPNLGQQCAHSNCQQLDFLPLQCKCGKQFCSEHFNKHVQVCETSTNVEVEPQKIQNVFKCSFENCHESSLVPLLCSTCRKHFCIKHRHITQCSEPDEETLAQKREKLAAPVRQFNEAKSAVDKQIEQNLIAAKKKGKNLANKVQLMKIKNKAKGLNSIPTSDRVYFNVTHPETGHVTPVFVSKIWSLGRAIDAIASECKLRNDNNKSGEKKLRLFKQDSGEISKNLADGLEKLISDGVIMDGENLIITYVDDN
ncbi:AN1-type zinc finger protein 1-like [Tribolium castaneum]|uniref:AN1-type zinc finger protein 1-like n=1 Tax=Tribolium castaneum TaxID=7070 RepID=UPI00017582D1|nr:PREDICTED: AN1-type zinc finger protein 1-like [Tribolium castaneum]|eukprot:XP_001812177.1 PREDICTED: AN1-type zinc finger protein 1-like [Tribolium castaneum]